MTATRKQRLSRNVNQRLRQAIEQRDLEAIAGLVGDLRFRHRLNYHEVYRLVGAATGMSLPEWDELLYEVDHHDG